MSTIVYPNITTHCDTEPIHLIGRIQSHGYLLAFNQDQFTLEYISSNVPELFDEEQLAKLPFLKTLFGEDIYNEAKNVLNSKLKSTLCTHNLKLGKDEFQVAISTNETYIILELELFDSKDDLKHYKELLFIEHFLTDLQSSQSISELATSVAMRVREFSKFDRVMMYRLDENGDGEIIAEDKKFGLESFLGLNYPASDIPKQARKLYLTNVNRSLNNVNDEGLPLISLKQNSEELDLSYSVFRSMSPVHIQYLKNMGVTATHAISLIVDNKLWGLIICHHYDGAKYLNFNKRLASLLISNSVSQAIDKLQTVERKKLITLENIILDKIRYSKENYSIFERINSHWDEISKLIKADGFVVINKNNFESKGVVPLEGTLQLINNLYCKNINYDVVASSNLSSLNPLFYSNKIAGMLCTLISEELEEYLIFFRKEKTQIVNWAGNPNKAIEIDSSSGIDRLTPRGSFALWQETVEGKSEEWIDFEIEFVTHLRETLISKEIGKIGTLIIENEELTEAESKLQNLVLQRNNELMAMNLLMKQELGDTKEYQRVLELTKSAAEQLNKTKTEFLANMSHEMRTPINGIMGMAQLIQDDPDISADSKYYADIIIESSQRLVSTVSRILDMAKLENNKVGYKFTEVNLGKLFDSIIVPMKILAGEKAQDLILIIHNREVNFVIDELFINQIAINLISNAIKYSPRNSKIEVNVKIVTELKKKYLILIVEDNGNGIEKTSINKLFEPFFMEASSTNAIDNSSGLGLYLVKNYVDLLKGTIEVHSEKNKGSIFSVKIPLVH